ncbi:Protein of uncharacterised function (DUF1602) [Achromobacter ruhlandii]|nr:Protein of uncharacterised function (DUF1602) [Achromobacter ruhlandii]
MIRNTSSTRIGANPIDGSSSSTSSGFSITARAIASICCSPPDSVPANCSRRSFRRGNRSIARPRSACTSPLGRLPVNRGNAPSSRLSVTESVGNTRRPSGECANPSRAIRCDSSPSMRLPPNVTSPAVGRIIPDSARIVVVLPAPFEPISVTTLAFGTSMLMPCSTFTFP